MFEWNNSNRPPPKVISSFIRNFVWFFFSDAMSILLYISIFAKKRHRFGVAGRCAPHKRIKSFRQPPSNGQQKNDRISKQYRFILFCAPTFGAVNHKWMSVVSQQWQNRHICGQRITRTNEKKKKQMNVKENSCTFRSMRNAYAWARFGSINSKLDGVVGRWMMMSHRPTDPQICNTILFATYTYTLHTIETVVPHKVRFMRFCLTQRRKVE